MSGELTLLSDGGLLLDFPDLWLELLLLFEVPLCAELGRKVNRLGCTPADVKAKAECYLNTIHQHLCTFHEFELLVQCRKHSEIFEGNI
jgi:hypothetical protein